MLQIERSAKRPSRAIGFLAALRAFPHAKGGGAPARSRKLVVLSSLCVSVAAFLCASVPALAATPETPEVFVLYVHASEARLLGVLNPGPGAAGKYEAGKYQYVYRPSSKAEDKCEGAGELRTPASQASFPAEHEALAYGTLTGLVPDTEYAVCLVAFNEAGTAEAISAPIPTIKTTIAEEAPENLEANPIGPITATLRGLLNPKAAREAEPGSYEFLYKQGGECEEGKTTGATKELGHEKEAAKAEVRGLLPNTQYTFCLLVSNEAGTEAAISATPVTFTTPVGPPVVTESVSEVADDGATLDAEIVPGGGATTYHFEYIDQAGYEAALAESASNPYAKGTSTPESASIGSDSTAHPVSEPIQPLLAGTEYHYRVVAHNPAGGGAGSTVYGPDQTFTTQGTATGFRLPDGRGWEQVSPVDKHGAGLEAMPVEGGVIEAAVDGSAITYVASAPAVSEPAGNVSLNYTQMLSTRGVSGGWSSRDLATARKEANGVELGYFAEYKAFSPDLSVGLVEPPGEPDVSPLSAPASEKSIYLREGLREGESATLYTPLVDDADVTPGTHYGKESKLASGAGKVSFIASTENAEHVVIESKVPILTANAEAHPALYEWTEGTLRPVSILPDREWVEPSLARIGDESYVTRGAISSDGQRVFWTTLSSAPGGEHIYMRDTAEERTVQLDLPQGGAGTPSGSPKELDFQYATPNGEKVYFTDTRRLTLNATAEYNKPELYEYNTHTNELVDLTPNPEGTTSSDVQGEILGATSNGEYVYFVADGVLAEGSSAGSCEPYAALSATCNLYLEHVEGKGKFTIRLIAVLSTTDEHDWQTAPEHPNLFGMTSRMSPNGEYLAFMSDRSLTGYDNTDVSEEEVIPGEGKQHADEEVFLYDASTNHLECASCNPTGARPHGVFDTGYIGGSYEEGIGLLVDRPELWGRRWLAGSLPGWTKWAAGQAQYQSRYLSDEGRLFFDATDALVPQDTNGKEDVYEYEPEHVGGRETPCGEAAESGSEVFKHEHAFTGAGSPGEQVTGTEPAGCVGLISSGTSTKESAFLDASENGDDVFFLTASPLSLSDSDQSYDVYDAHACTGLSPCASTVVAPPPCTTADSCRAAPTPQPAIFGAPASATFSGAGNVTPGAPTTVTTKKKTAAELKAEKLAKALKVCRKDKKKSKRATCETQARRKYAAKPKSKQKAKSHKGGK
jgi:hypothetical protein